MNLLRRLATSALVASIFFSLAVTNARAVTIDWVTVGDPGNTADTTGVPNPAGAVIESFQIMKYEFTNEQYKDFLNSVAATDTYSLYDANMGSNARGGITRSGSSGSYSYTVKTNMGDKPVNYVSWFDAARVANWLMNGATSSSSTETGAYTLVSGQTSGTAPARNSGATFYIPTEDQWYKAAYYKGGSTNAGYWDYATQSDTAPTAVTSGSTGIGTAGSTGNLANYNSRAIWNGEVNVTTVGTNGGSSFYGAFDMSGNLTEWNDLTGAAGSSRGLRGGHWNNDATDLSSSVRLTNDPSVETTSYGFRLASPVAVPEPSTYAMAIAGLACGGFSMWRRRKPARSVLDWQTSMTGVRPDPRDGVMTRTRRHRGMKLRRLFALCPASRIDAALSIALGLLVVGTARAELVTLTFSGTYDTDGRTVFGVSGADVPYTFEITYNTALDTNPLFFGTGVALGSYTTTHPWYGYSASGVTATSLTFGSQTWTAGDLSPQVAPGGYEADLWFDADIGIATPTRSWISFAGGSPGSGDLNLGGAGVGINTVEMYQDSSVLEFDYFSTGYSSRMTISVLAVPEPSTYAMALAGLACGGFSMWRRRKRA